MRRSFDLPTRFQKDDLSFKNLSPKVTESGRKRFIDLTFTKQTDETKISPEIISPTPKEIRKEVLSKLVEEQRERRSSDPLFPRLKVQNLVSALLTEEKDLKDSEIIKYLQDMPYKQREAVAYLYIYSSLLWKNEKIARFYLMLELLDFEPKEKAIFKELILQKSPKTTPIEYFTCRIADKYKWIVIHSFFLLFLMDEHNYDSRIRMTFINISFSLNIKLESIYQLEDDVSIELYKLIQEVFDAKKKQKESSDNKGNFLLFGTLSVLTGGVLLLTGGLATPILIPAISGLMSSVGVIGAISGFGTIATVTLLGSELNILKGGKLLLSLFNTIHLSQLISEDKSIKFLETQPLLQHKNSNYDLKSLNSDNTDVYEKDIFILQTESDIKNEDYVLTEDYIRNIEVKSHKPGLLLYLCVPGFLNKDIDEFGILRNQLNYGEIYTMEWESNLLFEFGKYINKVVELPNAYSIREFWISKVNNRFSIISMINSLCWSKNFLGQLPYNPLRVLIKKAVIHGKTLANLLMQRVHGKRPLTLIGLSLGANILFSCLEELVKNREYGLIQNVVFIGGTVSISNASRWKDLKSVIPGRFINAYSSKDWIISYLFRDAKLNYEICGLEPCFEKFGIENIDISKITESHFDYQNTLKLEKIFSQLEVQNSIKFVFL